MPTRASFSGWCKTRNGEQDSTTPNRNQRALNRRSPLASEPPEQPAISFQVGVDSEWTTHQDPTTGALFNAVESYQLAGEYKGKRVELIRFTTGRTKRHRITLETLLVLGIRKAIKEKVLPYWPSEITVFCHFLRADITAFDNFWPRKQEFDGFGRTFTAHSLAYTLDASANDEGQDSTAPKGRIRKSLSVWKDIPAKDRPDAHHRVNVRFIDTMLLTPGRGSLETAANLIGKAKKHIPDGFFIERMDLLRKGDLKAFTDYALQDAHLALDYGLELQRFAAEIGLSSMPSTLSGFAIALAKQEAEKSGLKLDDALGVETQKFKVFDEAAGRYRTIRKRVASFSRQITDEFAALAYHGGRAESSSFGPTEVGTFYDWDLPSAYTTAMCLLRPLDYDNARISDDAREFQAGVMGAARVEFSFPIGTRFPCLPVRHNDTLFFPLKGRSVCTSPEIALALSMGAEITVLNGMIIPWAADDPIFESFTERVQLLRAQFGKNTLWGQLAKEIGNSLYGKSAQGVKPKRVLNTQRGRFESMPPSSLTAPWFPMYVAGFIRAVLGEILHGVPDHRVVVSATTDGFLTDAPEDELCLTGPLCTMFANVRHRMFGPGKILEEKHRVAQVVAMRTRGQITGEFLPGYDEPVLAKTSVKPPVPKPDHNEYMLRLFLGRTYGQTHIQKSLISLSEQWYAESDLVGVEKTIRLNLEYDFKRCPIRPTERLVRGQSHLAFDSVPWETADDAHEAIQRFRDWRCSHKRLLKTLPDFLAWEAYHTMAAPVRAAGVGLRGDGALGHLYRQFLRALVRGEWGLSLTDPLTGHVSTYGEIEHWLITVGFPNADVNDLKNAKRSRAKLAHHTICLDDEALGFLQAIVDRYPEFYLEQAMHPKYVDEACAALKL